MPVKAKGSPFMKALARTLEKSMIRSGKKLAKKGPAPQIPKGVFDRVPEAKSEFFTVGFAKTDIMPDDIPKKKYYVAGYKAWNPAKSVLDPMTTSAVWIDDNSGRGGIVMVSVDSVGLTDYDADNIRRDLADFVKQTNCRSINLCSTHNHAGIDTIGMWGPLPKSGRDKKYMKIVYDGIKKVIREAYDNRKDGDIYFGKKETPEIQRDSRLPHVFNKELARLRFVPKDGSTEVWMLKYDSHTENMLGLPIVSADFACYLRRGILESAGAESIYFTGPAGGLIRLKELDKDPIESTKIAGKELADTAIAIEDERKLEPKISILRQEYYSPADNYALAFICSVGIIKKAKYPCTNGKVGVAVKTEMTYMQIGDLNILMLPNEIFPELCYGGYLPAEETAEGKSPDINPDPLQKIAGDDDLLFLALVNDFTGYVVPPNDFFLHPDIPYIDTTRDRLDRGHYEETNSLGPDTAYIVADTFKQMMETVKAAEKEE